MDVPEFIKFLNQSIERLRALQFLKEEISESKNAGSKARQDIECILERRYKSCFILKKTRSPDVRQKIGFLFSMYTIKAMIFFIKNRRRNIIIQYPFYINRLYRLGLQHMIKRNNSVFFVHDIDSIRSCAHDSFIKECILLNNTYIVILHNDNMLQFMKNHGVKASCISLELFDYLLPGDTPKQQYFLGYEIVFAGNLAKSEFIESIPHKKICLQFNLFGNGLSDKARNNPNIFYQGSFTPDEIPYKLRGSFGLVWDGNSLDTCSGDFGEYLKLNNPHKLSLYIAAGIPVIVWKQAAIAQLVDKYNIGFCVDSIQDISSKINSLNATDYSKYLENIKKLQKLVITGYFTNRALDQVEKIMGENLLHKES